MHVRGSIAVALLAFACGSKSSPPIEGDFAGNPDASYPTDAGKSADSGTCSYPPVMHLTVGGFTTCMCLNGTFTLALEGATAKVWRSAAINGCPGQTETAYYKFSSTGQPAIGITDLTSEPGSGASDYSPATSVSCNPLGIGGGRSTAGNTGGACDAAEDAEMHWSLGP